MKPSDQMPASLDDQPSFDDQLKQSMDRLSQLGFEATNKLHSNGTRTDDRSRKVPSFTVPIEHESGLEAGEIEIHHKGLIGDEQRHGLSIDRRNISNAPDPESGIPKRRITAIETYWLDTSSKTLYRIDTSSRDVPEARRLHKCSDVEALDVSTEIADLIEAALRPQENPESNSEVDLQEKGKKHGSFITRLTRKFFPSQNK